MRSFVTVGVLLFASASPALAEKQEAGDKVPQEQQMEQLQQQEQKRPNALQRWWQSGTLSPWANAKAVGGALNPWANAKALGSALNPINNARAIGSALNPVNNFRALQYALNVRNLGNALLYGQEAARMIAEYRHMQKVYLREYQKYVQQAARELRQQQDWGRNELEMDIDPRSVADSRGVQQRYILKPWERQQIVAPPTAGSGGGISGPGGMQGI